MNWEMILSVIAGLATAIPLAARLIEYVVKAVKEKNWSVLLKLVMTYMEEAEKNPDLQNGAAKKAYVLDCIEKTADTINYDVDVEAVSALIDELCGLTKKVNANV